MSLKSSIVQFSTVLALVGPSIAEAHGYYPTEYGTVYVTNQTGAAMFVTVDGQAMPVASGRTQVFQARAGEVGVRATYREFGADRVLTSREVYVRSSRPASVVLTPPSVGLVRVENQSDRTASVLIDGQLVASLQPYQARILSTPVGCHDMAMVAGSWTIDRERIDVRAFAEPNFIAQMPRVNDLVVVNPLPIPIQLVTDRGQVRTLEPRAQLVFDDVAVGTFHVSARRLTGERVDDINASIRPDMVTTWRVDPPSSGLVDIRNEEPVPTRLIVDGRMIRSLGADQDTRVELGVGQHQVQLLDDRGMRLLDTWVTVDPYDIGRIYAAAPQVGRNGYDQRDDHQRSDAQPAAVAEEDVDRWDRQSDEAEARSDEHGHCEQRH